MLSAVPIVPGAAALGEAKAYLRVIGADEDALIEGLVATAADLCEAFTGRMLIARPCSEMLPPGSGWMRLAASPARAITGIEAVGRDGSATLLAPGVYTSDIDARGDGWVRVSAPGEAGRVRVAYEAGLAVDWAGIPEALRHGIVRLAAHFYSHRAAAEGGAPPAAVTALWRPWRRMALGHAAAPA